jgi:hypothetical protein
MRADVPVEITYVGKSAMRMSSVAVTIEAHQGSPVKSIAVSEQLLATK